MIAESKTEEKDVLVKVVIERVQSHACMSYAEREQARRSQGCGEIVHLSSPSKWSRGRAMLSSYSFLSDIKDDCWQRLYFDIETWRLCFETIMCYLSFFLSGDSCFSKMNVMDQSLESVLKLSLICV